MEKVIQFIGNSILILIAFSLFLSGIISDESTLVSSSFLYIILGAGAAYLFRKFTPELHSNKSKKERRKHQMSAFLVFIFITVAAPLATARYGHILLTWSGQSKEVELELTVDYVSSTYGSAYCAGAIRLKGYSHFANGKLCGVSRSIWSQLKSGDRIIVQGIKTYWGFEYTNLKKNLDKEIYQSKTLRLLQDFKNMDSNKAFALARGVDGREVIGYSHSYSLLQKAKERALNECQAQIELHSITTECKLIR
ncbi:hypothetical protein AN944_02292 [Shewanella sp. P1-14-1]|uniref:hypothetical protein n=1 Tax=Shewanella sp. P1-14-1 TaxID=1723761 RepID=UPI0006D652AC|nr:hypothetical protein [Shewanella sp. P1-14-1]KPZ70544.1 hypothetical protein AN944_02292 [Shewanella sp. P1-14-1]